jgi:hypothetical protein
MAQGRKVRHGREAAELLKAWSTSGEPMAAWCDARGINWYSLSAYKGWHGVGGDGFVEAVVETAPAPGRDDNGGHAHPGSYRVVLGRGRILEVDSGFDEGVLQRLVRAIEAC